MKQTIILDGYLEDLYLLEELEQLNEVELKKAIEKFTPRNKLMNVAKKLQKVVDMQNPKETLKKLKSLGIPNVKFKKVVSYLDKKSDIFEKNRKKAEIIIKNSLPEADRKLIPIAATVVAIKSITKPKRKPGNDPDKLLKNSLREFVGEVREVEEEHQEKIKREMLLDYAIGAVIVSIALGIIFLILHGGLAILAFIKGIIMAVILVIILYQIFLITSVRISSYILYTAK